eukprot:TRINITY_DN108575_c0_g1_i1.p1 TRINITY_DN108575_c0_g1~~TRINITY_DN108575_c0_g1_i1.p1  ORF type:complete len:654 (-),score=184.84 TRINITY_DN108575_c0_g1_i1:19-1980(-)
MAADEEADLAAAIAMSMASGAAEGQTEPTPADAAAAALGANNLAALSEAGTIQVLSTLLGNLVKCPDEEKFRRVKLSNAKISKALSCKGAADMLLAAGFVRVEEVLEVPGSVSASQVKDSAQAALDALGTIGGGFALSAQLRAEGEVRCVAALCTGGLAFAGMDNVVRVYSAPSAGSWGEPQLLFGHERRAGVDGVLALAPGIDDSADLISAGRDGKIISWRSGREAANLNGHGEGVQGTNVHVVSSLGRSADGLLLSGGWDKTVRTWKGETQVAMMAGHDIAVNAIAGLENGDIASGSGDQSIGIWRDAKKLHSLAAQTVVRALCACGGSLLASAGNDGKVRLWDAETGKQVADRSVTSSYVLSLARCKESGELAAGAASGQVFVLAHEGTSLRIVEELQHCGEVYGLAFLENGDLAAACGDSSCIVWSRSASRNAPKSVREEFMARARAMAVAQQTAATSASSVPGPGGGGGSYDFTFPVDFGTQKFSLAWNRGEEPKQVAERFIQQNALDPKHTGDVVAFVMQTMQQQMTTAYGGAGGAKDFNYPVEVADGRKLTISWNRGDNPQEVAVNFARQYGGIAANELPDIVNFIQQVSGGPAPMQVQQAPAITPAMQQQMMQQVMEMGFDQATAKMALEAANWDVESAVTTLLG